MLWVHVVNLAMYMPVHSILSTFFTSPFQTPCPISTPVIFQFHRLLNSPPHSPDPMRSSLYSEKFSLTFAFSCAPKMESEISSETLVLLCHVALIHIPTHVAGEIQALSDVVPCSWVCRFWYFDHLLLSFWEKAV